jgi:hypothetical protein
VRDERIQSCETVVRPTSSVPQYIIDNQPKPVPAPSCSRHESTRYSTPKNARLTRDERRRIGEEGGEGRASRAVADERGEGLEDRVEAPAADTVKEEAEEEALEEGGGTGDEGETWHEDDSVGDACQQGRATKGGWVRTLRCSDAIGTGGLGE